MSNAVPLEDVITEMFLGPVGGPGDCYFDASYTNEVLDRPMASATCELMEPVTIEIYDWPDDTPVRFLVTDPNGRTLERDMIRSSDGILRAAYQPALSDPTGVWSFELDPDHRKLRWEVTIQPPQDHYLYLFSDDPFDLSARPFHLLLTGFQPNENVRLIGYYNFTLAGWQDVRVGPDGSLEMASDIPSLLMVRDTSSIFYVAYGDQTGEVHLLSTRSINREYGGVDLYCPGARAPRLKLIGGVLSYGRVASTDGTDLRVHTAPGFSAPVSARLPEGTSFVLLEHPQCADAAFWWNIRADALNGQTGWVAESQNGVYLLEPLPPDYGFPTVKP